jgi:hypothetical protein
MRAEILDVSTSQRRRNIPRWQPVALVAAFIVVSIVILAKTQILHIARAAHNDGQLASDSYNYDFGVITPSAARTLQHTFQVQNGTSHAVRILGWKTSCGCTTTDFQTASIASGKTIAVPLSVKWQGRIGFQHAAVVLTTDDIKNPIISLQVQGNVMEMLSVSPASLHFGSVGPGSEVRRIVDVGGPGQSGVYIIAVKSSHKNIVVKRVLPDQTESDQVAGPLGRFSITFSDDGSWKADTHPRVSFLTRSGVAALDLTIDVTASPLVTERTLFWPASKYPFTRYISVCFSNGDVEATIDSDLPAASRFTIEPRPWGTDGRYIRIPVRFDPKLPGNERVAVATLQVRAGNKDASVTLAGVYDGSLSDPKPN